jgi:hypothetical protein
MTIVTTTVPDDEGAQRPAQVSGLGSFKKLKKGFKKIAKPIGRIAKPLLSMAQGGGGLLTAMGPWGMAAGAALAAGGALADRHRQKKLKKKQRRAQRATMAQAAPSEAMEVMPTEPPGWPPAVMAEQPAPQQEMPSAQEWASEPSWAPPAEPFTDTSAPPTEPPPAAVMVLPSDEVPEVQAVLDPEPVTIAGLGAPTDPAPGIDWRSLSVVAGFTLGTWWLLRDRRPSPRSHRR